MPSAGVSPLHLHSSVSGRAVAVWAATVEKSLLLPLYKENTKFLGGLASPDPSRGVRGHYLSPEGPALQAHVLLAAGEHLATLQRLSRPYSLFL